MEEVSQGKKKEEENREIKDRKAEEILRISVSKATERALIAIIDRVNDGFEGGRVNRTQLANWVFARAAENLSDADVQAIRAEYFDEISVLEAVLRKVKESGQVPKELREFLQQQAGFDSGPKRAVKNRLTKNVINGDIGEENEARGNSAYP